MCGRSATIVRLEDIFAVQDEVVRTVAATLAGRLEAAGAEGLRRRPTASLSAYECVLRGNALPVGDPVHEAAAHQLFEQAVALDPDYARAYAQLAISHVNRWLDAMNELSKDLDRALELATRAVVLDAQEMRVPLRPSAMFNSVAGATTRRNSMPERHSRLIRTGRTRSPTWPTFSSLRAGRTRRWR